uniref:Uncharacterized protein n=1 Tax=Anguilla anguilla TaxID=7936 RepID=A0A0E9SP92_ANGAN
MLTTIFTFGDICHLLFKIASDTESSLEKQGAYFWKK